MAGSIVNLGNAPVVKAPPANVSANAGQVLQLSSLFSATDPDGDALTYYLYNNTIATTGGHFVVNGVTVPNDTAYAVTAAQFAQTTFVAGAAGTSDDLNIRVYDGHTATNWSEFHVNVAGVNHAPVVTAPPANVAANAGQSLQLSSLLSATDPDGDALTYYLYNNTIATTGGHFVVNGVTVPNDTVYAVSAAQFAQTTFAAGAAGTSDDLNIRVYDGHTATNWSEFHVNVAGVNHAPVVTAPPANVAANAGQSLQLSSLLSATDLDGDALTYYLYNNTIATTGGHFVVNGVTVPNDTAYAVTAAQFAQTTFVAGAAGTSDDLNIRVYDGHIATNWSEFHVNVAAVNHAPVVTAPPANVSANAGQSLQLSSLLSATDPDGDALTYYLYNNTIATTGGHFVVNGLTVPNDTVYAVTAAQFAQTTFVAGAAGASDDLNIRVYDGHTATDWSEFHVNVAGVNHAPVVTAPLANVAANAGQSLQLSSLLSATDPDGDALTYYLYNNTVSTTGGHFVVNGTVVPNDTEYAVTAAQFAQTTFVAGEGTDDSDDLNIKVSDGRAYSDWNEFHVNVNHAPVVTANAGQGLQLSAAGLQIVNQGDSTASFNLTVDGHDLFTNADQIIAEIEATPQFLERGFAFATWQWLMEQSYAFDPYTGAVWQHAPYLYLDSMGFGYCDDVATVFADIMMSYGLEARIWEITGHVVSEVFTDGRWELYDADVGAIYIDSEGNIAGYDYIVASSDDFEANLLNSIYASDVGAAEAARAYGDAVLAVYKSTGDNLGYPAYALPAFAGTSALSLPAGGSIEIHPVTNETVYSVYDTLIPDIAELDVHFGATDHFEFEYPLVPVAISGTGEVSIDGTSYAIGSAELEARLASRDLPIYSITATTTGADNVITYLINPERFSFVDSAAVELSDVVGNVAVNIMGGSIPAQAGQVLQLASLFSATDADGDTLIYYLYNKTIATTGGHFEFDGAPVANDTVYTLTAAQFAQATFVAGGIGASDDLSIKVYDGHTYSDWSEFHVNFANQPPVVTPPPANVAADAGEVLQLASLLSATDVNGDALTYFLYNATTATGAGHFEVNGAVVPNGAIYSVTAAQFAQASFIAGASGASDELSIKIYDGHVYTDWSEFHVNVNHTPVVTPPPANVAADAGQVLQLSGLFSATDADSDALTYYLYDNTIGSGGGHFEVNGVILPHDTVYAVTAAQFAQTAFVAGEAGISDDLAIKVYDGHSYSDLSEFHVNVNHAPAVTAPSADVSANAGEVLQLSSLFSATDADGDTLTYSFYNNTVATTGGHFEVNGTALPNDVVSPVTAAEWAQVTFVAGPAGASDDLNVRVFDGHGYTPWSEFHIVV